MVGANNELKVFVGSANPELGKRICAELGVAPGAAEVITFSEGNTFVRILENVRGRNVFIVQGISHPVNDNFTELLFWIDAFRLASAAQITAIIPFFSYAKGDKKDEPRVSIRARVCADCIEAAGVDRVLMMDLHSPQIQGFFHKPIDHLYARGLLANYIKSKNISDLVVASADVGFGKSAFKFGEALGAPVVIGNKIRVDHSETAKIWNVVGDVKGKNVVIVDDIIFTGSSLAAMANEVMKLGAKSVYAAVTHGVLTKGSKKVIENSPIKELIITDTVEKTFDGIPANTQVVSVGNLFAEAIMSVHENRSISKLFP